MSKIKKKVIVFSKDNDITLLARCIFGEARSESEETKAAVGYIVKNRVTEKDRSYYDVILQKKHFSCFNKNDPNYKKVQDPEKYDKKQWKDCLRVSKKVIEGKIKNPIGNATHYHSYKDKNSLKVSWLKDKKDIDSKFEKKIGNIWFFKGIKYSIKKIKLKPESSRGREGSKTSSSSKGQSSSKGSVISRIIGWVRNFFSSLMGGSGKSSGSKGRSSGGGGSSGRGSGGGDFGIGAAG